MGYYSEVAFALPESEWKNLVSINKGVENSVFDIVSEEVQFERDDLDDDADTKWILIRWYCIKWKAHNESIKSIQRYLDYEEGPYEFLRLGEDSSDIEYISNEIGTEILGVRTEIEVYL